MVSAERRSDHPCPDHHWPELNYICRGQDSSAARVAQHQAYYNMVTEQLAAKIAWTAGMENTGENKKGKPRKILMGFVIPWPLPDSPAT